MCKKEGRRSYDVVVYGVGLVFVVVILLVFLRGFYCLKFDRKRLVIEILVGFNFFVGELC